MVNFYLPKVYITRSLWFTYQSDGSFLKINFSLPEVNKIASSISENSTVTDVNEIAWALKALMLTDLTTLAGDDTAANVSRLCVRACLPFEPQLLGKSAEPTLLADSHCAAVCVYPARAGFPTGQYGLNSRLDEISYAIEAGATEIDIVINRQLALVGDWEGVYNEVVSMRKACGDRAHLKTILAIGELGSMENVSYCQNIR